MPQPYLSQVHVNRPLTNISVAYIQDSAYFVSTKGGAVPSDKKSNVYFTYDQNDWFRDEAKPRAAGDESAGGGYNVADTAFNCQVYAYHKDVDEQVRLNTDDPLDGKRDAIKFVTHKMLIRQEIQWVADFFTTGIWTGSSTATDITPAVTWDDPTSTPIEDVQLQQASILKKTGFLPNKLTLGFEVYQKLVRHPDVIDLIKYGASAGNPAIANEDALAKIFGVDEVVVSKSVYASNAEKATAVYALTAGKNALLEHVAANPGLYTPSSRYTFMWTGVSYGLGLTIGAYEIPMPWRGLTTVRCEAQIAFSNKVIGATLGAFFSGAVA
ncbi:MAG: major capsid protein [Bryobacteraceae bacterium]